MKLYLVFIAAVAAAQVAIIHGLSGRVSFATTMSLAEQLKFNYHVQIHTVMMAGGILIAPDVILTAAHVVDVIRGNGTLYLGTTTRTRIWFEGGYRFTPDMVIIHENYTNPGPSVKNHMHYDIALIILDKPVTLSKTVGTIPLASKNNFDCENVDAAAWVSGHGGFGKTTLAENLSDFELTQMRYSKVQPLPLEECRKTYKGLSKEPLQLCSVTDKSKGFGGICPGDSGGAYAFDNPNDPNGKRILCGINSFAGDCEKDPSGFISVPYFVEWICEKSGGRVGCGL